MSLLSFFQRLLNAPTTKLPTKTQRFTFYSAFIVYVIGGITMFFLPDLMKFGFNFNHDGMAHFSLVNMFLAIIGFSYMALNTEITDNQGVCLATVLSRVTFVPLELWYLGFYRSNIIPLKFVFLYAILDPTLALVTFIIWYQETENASFKQFFKEIWLVLIPLKRKKINIHVLTQWIGYVQFFGWVIFHCLWSYTGAISNKISGTHNEGVLLVAIFMLALHGWFHILAGGSGNGTFAKASIIYRVTITIPYIFYLVISSQIERSLAAVLFIFDVFCAVLLFFGINYDKSVKKN